MSLMCPKVMGLFAGVARTDMVLVSAQLMGKKCNRYNHFAVSCKSRRSVTSVESKSTDELSDSEDSKASCAS